MSLKAKIEAIIYAAEEPVTIEQILSVTADEISAELGSQPSEASLPMAVVESDGHPTESDQTLADAKQDAKQQRERSRRRVRDVLEELVKEYDSREHGMEIRQVAGGYRMSTKPEHHDVVRSFAKSLKPPIRLSLQALETLAVVAYKQPVTVPEISEIRGVDSSGVIGTLLERKLITTAGRKSVVGRPMLYKTTKDFLVRFGLSDLNELPSIEEFEKLAAGDLQEELFSGRDAALADATGVPDVPETSMQQSEDGGAEQMAEDKLEVPQNVTEPTVSSDPHHTP